MSQKWNQDELLARFYGYADGEPGEVTPEMREELARMAQVKALTIDATEPDAGRLSVQRQEDPLAAGRSAPAAMAPTPLTAAASVPKPVQG